MTSTCFRPENLTKSKTWSGIFSTLNTEPKSCSFMKQLTRACISNILYLRKIFPDSYFDSVTCDGASIKLLKSGKSYKYADRVDSWLEGAFDAIEKRYLKHLMLDIKDSLSNMTLEIYTVTFSYQDGNEAFNFFRSGGALHNDENGDASRQFTISNTRLKTVQLLQMCDAVTRSSASLPPQVTLAIRLSYYDNTPTEYQPQGYKACEPAIPVFPKGTRSVEIGVTGTSYHIFKLVNKSCYNDNFFKKLKRFDKKDKVKRVLSFDTDTSSQEDETQEKENDAASASKTNNLDHFHLSQALVSDEMTSSGNSPYPKDIKLNSVRCVCRSTAKSEMMFACYHCKYLVHSECFGILRFNPAKKVKFYCNVCHGLNPISKCHDKVLMNLKNADDQQKLALLRRILKFCNLPKTNTINMEKMRKIASPNCSRKVVEIVLNKLIDIAVVVPKKNCRHHQGDTKETKIAFVPVTGKFRTKCFLVNKTKLETEMIHYFYISSMSSSISLDTEVPCVEKFSEKLTKRKDLNFVDLFHSKKSKHSSNSDETSLARESNDSLSIHSRDMFY